MAVCDLSAADVVLSNLPGSGTYGATNYLTTTSWAAVGMTTSASAVYFSSLTGMFSNDDSIAHNLTGGIYSDAGGQPGSLLASFVSQSVEAGTPATSFTLATASAYTLAANTNYWFVVSDPPAQHGVWWSRDTDNTVPSVASGYSLLGYMGTGTSGGSWFVQPNNLAVGIAVDSIPEPSLALLLAAGLGALGMSRRRRGL